MNIDKNIKFDIEKTKLFYKNYSEVCTCAYCRNFCKVINKSYPQLLPFLEQFGVIIEKPVEAIDYSWTEDKRRLYQAIYSVHGSIKKEFKMELEQNISIEFLMDDKLFDTGMEEPYFLIYIDHLKLNWELEENPED